MSQQTPAVAESRWMRRFFTMWTGQAFSLIGSALVQFALVWWLTIETGSAVVLAIAAVMGVAPQVLLTPVAGALVDRWNRRRVMIAADGLTAAATMLLMLSFALGTVEVWQIYLVLLVRSCFQGFHWPAMQASTSLMVPEEHLARIGGLNQSIQGLSGIVAPPLGAVLIAALPMTWVLSVDLITAALAITALLAIRIPEVRRAEGRAKTSVLHDMAEALRYLRSWRGAFMVTGIFSMVNFLITPAFTLLPLLTVEHFGGGALEYATLESMAGVGMIAGGLTLGVWGGTKRKIVTCMSALALCGVGTAIIGFLPPDGLVMAVGCCLVIGLTISMVNGTIMAIMQKGVRADMQGRVFALLGAVTGAMSPLGLLLAGPVSEAIGVQPWFIAGGLLMVVIGGASFFVPIIMGLEDHVAEAVAIEQ